MGVARVGRGSFRWSRGTVAELFSGRNNSLGLLRLLLSVSVLVSHSLILGFGYKEPLARFSQGQTTLGTVAVFGFFVLSGILVTRSGSRLTIGRFIWHRALRLLPGLWACLLVTALLVAPFLFWRQHSNLTGFWDHPHGPLHYLHRNWGAGSREYPISGVMETAKAHGLAYNTSFNGALWSLKLEIFCYLGVAVLVLTGSVLRSRRVVVAVALVLGWLVVADALKHPIRDGAPHAPHGGNLNLPLLGGLSMNWLVYLGLAFAIGALFELYKEHVPVSDPLAALAALVMLVSLHYGAFYALGVPAFAYLLLWLAIRLPRPFQRVGRKHDYSYGIYIYGFVVEQSLAALGGARWGFAAYLGLASAGTLVAAMLSWHLVEHPALGLKDLRSKRQTPSIPAQATAERETNTGVLTGADR
ncbi:acyltransferase family protein [Streptomyces fildesensis]|uniref:Acyltransferase family protein n=1 Tax=Streptomyces fildesensis TaxID=375757 RepID=A0ABW8CGJ3_9ACTN